MKSELIMSGIGGQGVILAGKILCSTAAEYGYKVTLAPAYGQEKRGGRTSCQVVIDKEIGSPVISEADLVLVMDESSLKDYEKKVKKYGYLLVNSNMITTEVVRKDINVVKIPINDIAKDLGNPRSQNMVALGAILKYVKILKIEDVKNQLEKLMKKSIVDINKIAIQTGYDYIA